MTFWEKQKQRLLAVSGAALWTVTACVGSETVLEMLSVEDDGTESTTETDSSPVGGDDTDGNEGADEDSTGVWGFEEEFDLCGASVWGIDEFEINDPHLFGAMTNITHFRGDLKILNLDIGAEDTAPMRSLRCVDGDLYLHNVRGLEDLAALSNLRAVGGDLVIQLNDTLANVDDLKSLNTVGGDLVIRGNRLLSSLTGFRDIQTLGGRNLYIIANANLPTCSAADVYNGVSDQGWHGDACIFENSDDECGSIRQGCSDRFYWHP